MLQHCFASMLWSDWVYKMIACIQVVMSKLHYTATNTNRLWFWVVTGFWPNGCKLHLYLTLLGYWKYTNGMNSPRLKGIIKVKYYLNWHWGPNIKFEWKDIKSLGVWSVKTYFYQSCVFSLWPKAHKLWVYFNLLQLNWT